MNKQVELKAFCSKHSEVRNNSSTEPVDPSVSVDKNSNISDSPHGTLSRNKLNKLRIGSRNNVAVTNETSDNSDKLGDSRSQETAVPCSGLNARLVLDIGDEQPIKDRGKLDKSCEDVNASGVLNLTPILKKVMYTSGQ